MIFSQRRLEHQATAARVRLQLHQEEITQQTAAQLAQLRKIAAKPASLATAFAAGFVSERFRPKWDAFSSLAGLTLSLVQHEPLIKHLTQAFSLADHFNDGGQQRRDDGPPSASE